jgi:hypothetical protein
MMQLQENVTISYCFAVDRINWLRASARYKRWKEEGNDPKEGNDLDGPVV